MILSAQIIDLKIRKKTAMVTFLQSQKCCIPAFGDRQIIAMYHSHIFAQDSHSLARRYDHYFVMTGSQIIPETWECIHVAFAFSLQIASIVWEKRHIVAVSDIYLFEGRKIEWMKWFIAGE